MGAAGVAGEGEAFARVSRGGSEPRPVDKEQAPVRIPRGSPAFRLAKNGVSGHRLKPVPQLDQQTTARNGCATWSGLLGVFFG